MPRLMTLLCLFAASLLTCSASGEPLKEKGNEAGFKPIFDGKTLEDWEGDPKLWRAENGTIVGEVTADIASRGTRSHPARRHARGLRAEGRFPHARSRLRQLGHPNPKLGRAGEMAGERLSARHERQRSNTRASATAKTIAAFWLPPRPEGNRLATIISRESSSSSATRNEVAKAIKKHDWNEYDIIAQGNHIIQKINGQLMCEVFDEDSMARKDGIIAPATPRRPAHESPVPQSPH